MWGTRRGPPAADPDRDRAIVASRTTHIASRPDWSVSRDEPDDLPEADLDFLLGSRDRAEAMADRLRWTARRVGIEMDEARRIGDAFESAMRHRARSIPDDHHPEFLHPARTALILMDDVRVTDPAVLCAATLQDAMRPDLATPPTQAESVAGRAAADVLRQLPPPDADPERLLESLVTAPTDILALYLAAQLDRARHLHLGDPRLWTAGHERVTGTLIPLAHRCHPLLARRFERWAGAFRRRFLDRPG